MEKKAKVTNRMLRGFKQAKKAEQMRFGLDVAACGAWYRSNPGLAKPLYLRWVWIKFLHIVLKLVKSAGSFPRKGPQAVWMQTKLNENKRERDRIRRRLLLDAKIAVNYEICWGHGRIFFPICRSMKSDYYWHRRCPECHQDKQERWA